MSRTASRLTPAGMAAREIGMPHGTLLRWCRTGRVGCRKVGTDWMLTDAGLEEAKAIQRMRGLTVTKAERGGFRRYVSLAEFSRMTGIPYARAYAMARDGRLACERTSPGCGKAVAIAVSKEELARHMVTRGVEAGYVDADGNPIDALNAD